MRPKPRKSRKRKPVGKPRRTASIPITRHLERLEKEIFSVEAGLDVSEAHRAELARIKERNIAGMWTEKDKKRVQELYNYYFKKRKK